MTRPLADIQPTARHFDASINDVVLAASAGGMRRFLRRRGEEPDPLKAMVPASVRDGEASELGNRISFLFVDLPCDLDCPARRLHAVKAQMSSRKRAGASRAGDHLLRALGAVPLTLQTPVVRMATSRQAFNLVVSNVPGPDAQLYMLGCPLESAYPVVPIADGHALSIGVTSIDGKAHFGLYADAEALPDVDELAEDLSAEIDDLAGLAVA